MGRRGKNHSSSFGLCKCKSEKKIIFNLVYKMYCFLKCIYLVSQNFAINLINFFPPSENDQNPIIAKIPFYGSSQKMSHFGEKIFF